MSLSLLQALGVFTIQLPGLNRNKKGFNVDTFIEKWEFSLENDF